MMHQSTMPSVGCQLRTLSRYSVTPASRVLDRPLARGYSAATKAPKPLDRRGVAIGATTSDAVLLSFEQQQPMRAAEPTQLGGHPL